MALDGGVAVVTGATGSLGLASCHALARNGLKVIIADVDAAIARDRAAELSGEGHSGHGVDVTDEASVARLFDAAEHAHGPVSVLATFAGVLLMDHGKRPGLIDTSVENWQKTFAVNALGTFLCLREMLRRRTAAPIAHGRIITVSSIAAQLGSAHSSVAYAASKGAVISLTKSAAREAAPLGITVNTIAPGTFESPLMRKAVPDDRTAAVLGQIPLGRIGTHDELAATVAFLASKGAGYITGATIDINGGFRI